MKKERKVIEPNAIIVFDRNINVKALNAIPKDFKGDVIVNGDLNLDDDSLIMSGNLYVKGNIIADNFKHYRTIDIKGDLYCCGKIDVYDIDVSGTLCCMGVIDSASVKVSENLYCKDKIDALGYSINVAGDFECFAFYAQTVNVLGKIRVKGLSSADVINVGY